MARTINESQSKSRISVSIPKGVMARLEEAAALRGVSVAVFLAEAASREADAVIEKERVIQLSREDAELIASLNENPPPPNANLRKAARKHKRLIRG
ncbi:MAG: DUF1778 domain-containing protein [Planctomycetaceae bacterium]|nr:DUF1778 domain-containing protein [Planctomycetaceae bacterium]